MTFFLILISVVLIVLIFQMIRNRKVVLSKLLISIVIFTLLSTHTIGVLITKKNTRIFDEQLYSAVTAISWDDREYLESIGFYYHNDRDFFSYSDHNDAFITEKTSSGVAFSIWVEKKDKESAVKELRLKPYNDGQFYKKQTTSFLYDNFFYEFLGIPNCIDRDCIIYCDGYLIHIYEQNYESLDHSYSEETIYEIRNNQGE